MIPGMPVALCTAIVEKKIARHCRLLMRQNYKVVQPLSWRVKSSSAVKWLMLPAPLKWGMRGLHGGLHSVVSVQHCEGLRAILTHVTCGSCEYRRTWRPWRHANTPDEHAAARTLRSTTSASTHCSASSHTACVPQLWLGAISMNRAIIIKLRDSGSWPRGFTSLALISDRYCDFKLAAARTKYHPSTCTRVLSHSDFAAVFEFTVSVVFPPV